MKLKEVRTGLRVQLRSTYKKGKRDYVRGKGRITRDDGDGWAECDGDCDDVDALVSPAACERCDDEVDNDCDTEVDEDDCLAPLGELEVQEVPIDDQGGGCKCSQSGGMPGGPVWMLFSALGLALSRRSVA